MLFDTCDLDHDSMILVLKLDPDIVVTYLYTKNKVKRSFGSNIIVWKYRQTHRMCETFTYPSPRAVIKTN